MIKNETLTLKLALEALEDPSILNGVNNAKFFIKQALAEQEPSVDWQNIGALMEAHSKAKAAGLIGGTTSWGAFVALEMLETAAQPKPQPEQESVAWRETPRWHDGVRHLSEPPAGTGQPEQEPVAIYQYQMRNGLWVDHNKESHDYNIRHCQPSTIRVVYTIPPQPQPEERNFCPRCGKRSVDIHTCTPPQENTCPQK